MSVEHQPTPRGAEQSHAELEALAKEQLEKLATTPENAAEHAEKRAEAAREIIHKQEQAPDPVPVAEKETAAPVPFVARLDQLTNYTHTMASLQRKLRPMSRSFSKVIHTPAVEKTSEALEKTVMRPSVAAGATWTALLVGVIFYVTARIYGYALSGSEMLVALVIGGILGVALEGVGRLLRRRG